MFHRFISLLIDFYEYLLLIFLSAIAFAVLLMNEVPQVRALQGDIASTFAFIHYPAIWINQLSELIEENQRLKEDNLRLTLLNAEMMDRYLENQRLRQMMAFADTSHLKLLPAKVMNRGLTPVFNSILISVGRLDGVRPDMAVVHQRGVVGKTVSVGERTTLVQIFSDINFRLSVKFQSSRVFGILKWHSERIAIVENIPKTAIIHPMEIVITSGYSDIYPANIPFGEVLEIKTSSSGMFQVAYIQPFIDLNTIEEAFVVLK